MKLRCQRLDLECSPQQRAVRGSRPAKQRKVEGEDDELARHGDDREGNSLASMMELKPVIRPPPSVPDLLLPRKAADIMCKALSHMNKQGRLFNKRALTLHRQAALCSFRKNVDISLGICDLLLNLLGRDSVSSPVGPMDPNLDEAFNPPGASAPFSARCLPKYIKEVGG